MREAMYCKLRLKNLVPLEQFGLGGQLSVWGYRQDALLTDNGLLFSAEFRVPIVRANKINGVLQLTPFIDVGKGWNVNGKDPSPSTLVSTGLGLL
ncbi:ShlB/FhaC/HecB family hemolysin secretion/activation protein [Nostoc sp. UCD120]|uniref:ShlB/FhaC/HecB family hemolysin secretion/activation protein n=1 Tax=Nostoc sp. UCD120 TaxID=2681312 RepID=UPI0037C72E6C